MTTRLPSRKTMCAGNADHGGVVGNVAQHDRAGADAAVLAHGDVAQNFRSAADDHAVFDRGMAFAVFFARAAQSHSLIEGHVIANNRVLTDHDSHAVIDEQAPSDLGSGMNFNSRKEASDLRQPYAPAETDHGSRASDSCGRTRPHAGPSSREDFQTRLGRGIVLHHIGDVFAN